MQPAKPKKHPLDDILYMHPIKTKQISIGQNSLHAAIKTKQTSIRKDSLHATKPIKKYINNCLLINLLISNSSLRECYTNFEDIYWNYYKKIKK